MLYTILQIIAFQALFLLVYDLFLKRETFFNYNRAYLLITSVLSLVLPFVKLPKLKKIAKNDFVIQLPEVFIGTKTPTTYDIQIAERAGIIIEQTETPIWQLILITGIVIATFVFLFKLAKLYWLKHNNPKRWQGNVLVVRLIKSTAAFSFFNTIFLGERIPDQEKPTIYQHELVHIKEFHTVDLLLFEVLRILFWFNPLVYMYQNRIKDLHEYIADAKAVAQNGKSTYYQSLLNQVFDAHHVSFTNTFFKSSLIKKRIAMLQKSKSKQLNLLKYALLIPLVFGMLIYTSTEVRAQQKTTQDAVVDQALTDEELIKKYYDEIIELAKNERQNYNIIRNGYDYSAEKFIPTKTEYLKYVAYMRYMGERFESSAKKSGQMSTKKQNRLKNVFYITKSYEEYLEYLKTEEAKKSRDNALYNRTLQVISEDIDQLTEEEHKDAYEKVTDVLRGSLYRKLIITGKDEAVEISKRNYDALVRFFSAEEIKSLLSIVEVEVEEIEEVPFSVVEEVPTLKECQDLPTNEERKNCMNDFVNKHIGENFNTSVGDVLSPGRKRIFVQFKIDTLGYVTDIKARGPHPELEVEAKRVISSLPQFIPGKQKGKLVTVPYSLPIVFQAAGKTDASKGFNEDHNKQQSNTTTILINRKNQFLINDELGSFKSLTELLKTIPESENHGVRLAYDKETSKTIIKDVLDLIKQYPSITVEKRVSGPLSGDDQGN